MTAMTHGRLWMSATTGTEAGLAPAIAGIDHNAFVMR